MTARLGLLLCISVMLFCLGCRPQPTAHKAHPPEPRPVSLSQSEQLTAAANTRFAFKLFGKLRAEKPTANLFISPFSVSIALGMTNNGAAGETLAAMTKTLEMTGLSPEQINQGLQTLKAALMKADPKVELAIADSLWARQGIEFKPAFLDVNRKFYDAEVQSLNFTDPRSAETINGWVDKQTKGLIPDIIDAGTLRDLTTLVLLDAIYFKGKLSEPFKKSKTEGYPFTLLYGEKTVPLMSQSGNYRYMEDKDFQAISLPYGNGRLEMLVFLPAKERSLVTFCKGLTPQKWNEWIGRLAEREGTIKLPRFTANYDQKLNDVLVALGMGVAFGPGADFSVMSDTHMWIDFVRHKSCLKVDEQGTEAAAVTGIVMTMAPPPPPTEPFVMIVDRPFFLAIRDSGTNTILFMGAIVEPEE